MELSKKEIEIILKLRDEATGKINNFRANVKAFSNSTKDSLQPLLLMRQAWMKAGLAIGVTIGTISKGVNEIERLRKEVQAMDISAVRLGMTTAELSKKMYGFNVATLNARIGMGEGHAVVENVRNVGRGLVSGAANVWGGASKTWRAASTLGITPSSPTFLGAAASVINGIRTGATPGLWGSAVKGATNQKLAEEEERKARSQEALKINEEMTRKTKQLDLSAYEYKKYLLRQEVEIAKISGADKIRLRQYEAAEAQRIEEDRSIVFNNQQALRLKAEGRTLDALRIEQANALIEFKRQFGGDGEMVRAFIEGQQTMYKEAQLTYWGLKSEFNIYRGGIVEGIAGLENAIGGFYDVTTGSFRSINEVVADFGRTIIGVLQKMIAQFLIAKAVTGLTSFFSGGTIVGGVGGQTVSTGGQSIGGHVFNTAWTPYHNGGIIRAHNGLAVDEVPIIAQTGERVLSRRQTRDLEGLLSGNKNRPSQVVYNIYAIDAPSFVAMCQRNPEGIHAVVADIDRRNLTSGRGRRG